MQYRMRKGRCEVRSKWDSNVKAPAERALFAFLHVLSGGNAAAFARAAGYSIASMSARVNVREMM